MKKVLILHSDLSANGGAENFCFRAISLLQKKYEVSLLHASGQINIEQIKLYHEIEISSSNLKIIEPNFILKWASKLKRSALFKYALVLRQARKISHEYDFLISTYGECPIKNKIVIQCVHVPLFSVDKHILEYLGVINPSTVNFYSRVLYVYICRIIAGWSINFISGNLTIVNSFWTGVVIKECYGIVNSTCIYAAIKQPSINKSLISTYESREQGFVMVGRIHPSKRIELGIQLVDALRNVGYIMELHIIGNVSDSYGNKLREYIGARDYIFLHHNLSKLEMEKLIVKFKYGFHAYKYEHFGLAPAEMQRLGCVVFVPNSGGQVEIVEHPELQYQDLADAVNKVANFLKDEKLRVRILKDIENKKNRFSEKEFEMNLNKIIDGVIT